MLQYQQSAVGTICHQKLLGILNCKCNFSYFVLFEFIAIEFILYLPIRAVYPANCRLPRTRANLHELGQTPANDWRTYSGERSPEFG